MIDIYYSVEYCDWDIAPTDEHTKFDEYDLPIVFPDNKLDWRTLKSKRFDTEKEALEFATKIVEKSDEWLAYVEVIEHSIKVLKKFK